MTNLEVGLRNAKTGTSTEMLRSTPPKEIIAKPEGISYNTMVDESLIFSRSDDELRIIPAEQT